MQTISCCNDTCGETPHPLLVREVLLKDLSLNDSYRIRTCAPEGNRAWNGRVKPLRQRVYGTPGGTRTRNLQIRSLSPYPLGHGGLFGKYKCYHHWDRKIKLKVWLRVFLLCDEVAGIGLFHYKWCCCVMLILFLINIRVSIFYINTTK